MKFLKASTVVSVNSALTPTQYPFSHLVTANSRIFSKGWFVLSPALSASASPSASNPKWQDRRCQPANLPLTGGRVKQLCLGSLSMAGFAVTTEVLAMNQLPNWETLFGYQRPNWETLFGYWLPKLGNFVWPLTSKLGKFS
jgi:hypothetical protein